MDRGNEKTGKDKGRGRIGERGRNGEGKGEEGEEEKARGQTDNSCSGGKPPTARHKRKGANRQQL